MRSWAHLKKTAVLEPKPDRDVAVTAFVPARNEAEVIARSIEALIAQGRAVARIVAVDDRSTDGTREALAELVAAHPELTLIDGSGPKEGECGKPAALREAVERVEPKTEWLLFVDADVILEKGAVGALIDAALREKADLVSIVPRIEMKTAIEKLVMPSIGALVLAQYPPEKVADPAQKIAFANGQVILVRRSIYEAIGGHGAVVLEILEDVRLAERVKRAGGRLLIADGRRIARTRMYEGWRAIQEGWSRNLYLLIGSSVPKALGWLVAFNLLAWAGPLALVAGGWPIGAVAYAFILGFQMILRAQGGESPLWAVLAPVSSLLVSKILLRSLVLHRTRAPIPWKDRDYKRA